MTVLSKIFGDANERYTASLQPTIEQINEREAALGQLSDAALRENTAALRNRVAQGELLNDVLIDAFAVVREAAKRTLKIRHFDVQLIGGIVLHGGKIAEMRTGEGKTFVATLPLYLNALTGGGVHLVTPNDYLSRIGAGWMGPVYHALGVSVAVITHDMSGVYDPEYTDPQQHGDDRLNHFRPVSRHDAYAADITYGTNNEFGFDYLRDNLESQPAQLRQREHLFAIVDEIDSILIDEARTPLIISTPDEESAELYQVFARLTPRLRENEDYNVDEKLRAVVITEAGIDTVERLLNIGNIYEEKGIRFVRHLEQALRAQALFHLDRDYVVKNGEVIIVDEFTGRLMPGRRWSEGLHQAIEAKEGVAIQRESRTLATITFQNYFRMYKKLAGMTGTAQTSAEEFHKVYGLDVVTIPTHRPMIRNDASDLIFRTEEGKYRAVLRDVKERNERGQPVLIGTISIEQNERLSKMFQVEGVAHEVLNAKNHEREALIIAQAGSRGAVTIATNMAGRGVDIILGGNPPDSREAEAVKAAGGLHVIGTERHEARRIDNQLRGRAGRQGDPGSSRFFVALEDNLMRVFGSEKIKRLMESFGIPEDQPIEHRMVSRALEAAQAKIEGFHFDTRKHVLEFDDVLNKQRAAIYRMRRLILFAKERADESEAQQDGEELQPLRGQILEMIHEEIARLVRFHTASASLDEWSPEEIYESVNAITPISSQVHQRLSEVRDAQTGAGEKQTEMIRYLGDIFVKLYQARKEEIGDAGMRAVERMVMLNAIDTLWMEHLDQMEHLRDSVRLRAYGQRDPLVEYKNEGSRLFRELQQAIKTHIVNTIFKIGAAPVRSEINAHTHFEYRRPDVEAGGASAALARQAPPLPDPDPQPAHAAGRNDPCPCGSGKKYKKCHG